MLLGVLLAVIIVICIALVGVILLQRSEGGALGMSGGGPGNFMTARGTGDLLTKTTQILAAVFFVLCLLMTLISGHNRQAASVVDRLKINNVDPSTLSSRAPKSASTPGPATGPVLPAPTATMPATPAAPASVDPFAAAAKHAPGGSANLPAPAR